MENPEDHEKQYRRRIRKQVSRAASAATVGEYGKWGVGDRVRVLLRRVQFEKGTNQKWSSTVHTVTGFENGEYLVSDRVGGYKSYELLRVERVERSAAAAPEEVASLEVEVSEEQADRWMTRRVRKEGVERNDSVQRPSRKKLQRDLGPFVSR